jgi:hypothetical protein
MNSRDRYPQSTRPLSNVMPQLGSGQGWGLDPEADLTPQPTSHSEVCAWT